MKTTLKILGVIVALVAILAGSAAIYRANKDRSEVAQNRAEMEQGKRDLASMKEMAAQMTGDAKTEMDETIANAEAALKQVPTETEFLVLQVLLAGLLAMSFMFLVWLFRPNAKLALPMLGICAVLLVAAYIASPKMERGEFSGAPSHVLTLIAGIPALLLGLIAFGISKKSAVQHINSRS